MATNSTAGLEFLREYGAARSGGYGDAPDFLSASPAGTADSDMMGVSEENQVIDWGYEIAAGKWQPKSLPHHLKRDEASILPTRFVDGKDVGRVIVYVISPQGFPIPIRLSQIGAVTLRCFESGCAQKFPEPLRLGCESRSVEKVVAFMADLFPWEEVERFASALQSSGFRLLISRPAGEKDDTRDLAWLRENVRSRTREEMFRLERNALMQSGCDAVNIPPTISDGRLDDKEEVTKHGGAFFGIVKSQASTRYLHPAGWDALYSLAPGQRTPVMALDTEKLKLITWYVRLSPGAGGPIDGVVRVEASRAYFEGDLKGDFSHIDNLSRWLCEARTRDSGYSRAAVTLYPIQRAEDLLRARFQDTNQLISRFYRLTGL